MHTSTVTGTSPLGAARRVLAFPRGINVGGNNKVAMGELKVLLAEAGLGDPATVLNSGNVRVTTSAPLADVRATCERVLADGFGVSTVVLCFEASSVQHMIDDYPWDTADDTRQHYAVLMDDAAVARDMLAATKVKDGEEGLVAAPLGLFYWAFKGRSTSGMIAKTLSAARFKPHNSVRTVATLEKLLST